MGCSCFPYILGDHHFPGLPKVRGCRFSLSGNTFSRPAGDSQSAGFVSVQNALGILFHSAGMREGKPSFGLRCNCTDSSFSFCRSQPSRSPLSASLHFWGSSSWRLFFIVIFAILISLGCPGGPKPFLGQPSIP